MVHIDPPGWLLLAAIAFVAAGVALAVRREPVPPTKLARVSPAPAVAHYAAGLTTTEAQFCRMQRGDPIGGRFCDFGPCAPCQPAAWPCSVRTIVCDGEGCSW